MPGTTQQQADRERRFHALYTAHYPAMLAYAVRRTDVSDDAADVVADIFTTAWRRLDQVRAAPDDRLWLYGVAQRVVARRRCTRPAAQPDPPAPRRAGDGRAAAGGRPGSGPQSSDRRAGRLSTAEREALQLVLWEQLSHTEAAHVLGCSANAVAIRVHRAKARLRGLLAIGSDQPARPQHTTLDGR